MDRKAEPEGIVKSYNSQQYQNALDRYKHLYNSMLYHAAIGNDRGGTIGIGRRNLLRSDGLAICGSPYHRISRNNWPEDSWKFLAQFTKEDE